MIRLLSKKTFIISSVLLIIAGTSTSIICIMNIQHISDNVLRGYIILLTCMFILLSMCFITCISFLSRNRIKEIKQFRNKIYYLTQATNIIVIEYDVKKKMFIRWKDTGNEVYRCFSIQDYITHIYPEDLVIAMKLVKIMDGRRLDHYTCEFRYKFPNTKDYSWQYIDIHEYEIDKKGKVTNYIGICQSHNQVHKMKEQINLFRQKSSFILTSCNIYILFVTILKHT